MSDHRFLLVLAVGEPAVKSRALRRLADSIRALGPHAPRLSLAVGNRTGSPLPNYLTGAHPWDTYLELQLPRATGLSATRNDLLQAWEKLHGRDPELVVNFPDDDSYFLHDVDTFTLVTDALSQGADLVYGAYAPNLEQLDSMRFVPAAIAPSPRLISMTANSVSIFIRSDRLYEIGMFDVRLGAGSDLGSSEDLDLLLRAWRAEFKITYRSELVLGHDYYAGFRPAYWVGNVAALRKSLGASPRRVGALLLRRLVRGLLLALRGSLPVRHLALALRVALVGPRGAT